MPAKERREQESGNDDFVPVDEPMRELLEYVTGKPYPYEVVDRRSLAKMRITEDLINAFAWEALAVQLYRMRRGHFGSSRLMLGYALGAPETPYREKIRELTPEEARAEYMRLATAEAGMDEGEAKALLTRRLTDGEVQGNA